MLTPFITRVPSSPGEHNGPRISHQAFPAERRLKSRYPLDLGVRFRSLSEESPFSGTGRTISLSSGGVSMVISQHSVSHHQLMLDAQVEMSIEWPTLLDGRIPLQLFAVGHVVRHRASIFSATFERYEFRTMRSSSLLSVRSEDSGSENESGSGRAVSASA
jgi:hypothetical protein